MLPGAKQVGKLHVDDLNVVFLGVIKHFFRGHAVWLLCRKVMKGQRSGKAAELSVIRAQNGGETQKKGDSMTIHEDSLVFAPYSRS
uniref:Uncharacterized protein n=1 Tax=Leptospirillum ferrodiazotrophum TaxID=412449 RepID=C6HY99_9BACT|nr:MAG: hypothetical protein UBAL3_94170055a [Leptospirillum ferrodiazotrophum]